MNTTPQSTTPITDANAGWVQDSAPYQSQSFEKDPDGSYVRVDVARQLENSYNELREDLKEIVRRSQMLIHQNTGRWDMTVEHDARSHGVTSGNVRIAQDALGKTFIP